MKSKKFAVMLLAAVFAFSGAAFAQDKPADKPVDTAPVVKAEEPKSLVDVSGVLYLDYQYFMKGEISGYNSTTPTSSVDKAGQDNMRLMRAYVTFSKKIDDMWSMSVTLDGVGQAENKYTAADGATTTANNIVFLKTAYVEFNKSVGIVDVKAQYGLVGTPVVAITDKLSGARWIYNNYVEKSSDLLAGDSIDVASVAMGGRADVTVKKLVTLTGMYGNGDSFRYTEDQKGTDKAYWGMASITPIKNLYINGYYHKRDIAVANPGSADDDEVNYMGAGLAWSDKLYKVGCNYVQGELKKGAPTAAKPDKDYTLYDIWANINLQAFAGMPVLVYGRYSAGEVKPDGGDKYKATNIYAGIGYQFNKSVQAMLVYQTYKKDVKPATTIESIKDEAIYAKMEVKF
jgi:hypothetical protein